MFDNYYVRDAHGNYRLSPVKEILPPATMLLGVPDCAMPVIVPDCEQTARTDVHGLRRSSKEFFKKIAGTGRLQVEQ